jgi:hypothetical protein
MLEIETLEISCQYLTQEERFSNGIPTNYIIFKRLPGLGATYGEAKNENRNSIILEPNTPVLEGKRDALQPDGTKTYPNILVVYDGVEIPEVIKYLKSDISPKKILCTPEAYGSKVKQAIKDAGFNLYNDFFMLFDECDRLIKDVGYRDKIILPIKDFFKFKNKAMISATAIEPSDERFEDNGFKILKLIPSSNQRKKLNLISTNNILYSLREVLEKSKDKKVFIFINSIALAYILIKRLKIEDQSKIFCSAKGVTKLKRKHEYKNATSRLGDYAQFNFMTSRYFSAVDIFLDEEPNVIMITDVLRRSFTMLDPYTDSIQIVGRFRNGASDITHISNFSPDIKWKEQSDARLFIDQSYKCYVAINDVVKEHSSTEGGIITGMEALNGTKMSLFIDKDKDALCNFMLDNYLLEQKVRSNYIGSDELEEGYHDTDYFEAIPLKRWFDINDAQLLVLEKQKNTSEETRVVAEILHNHYLKQFTDWKEGKPFEFPSIFGNAATTIGNEYPEISDIYNVIGFKRMEELGFDKKKMLKESNRKKIKEELNNSDMIKEIQALYKTGDSPLQSDIKKALQVIYDKYNVTKKATGSHIQNYYGGTISTNKENRKVWKLTSIKPYEKTVLAVSKK